MTFGARSDAPVKPSTSGAISPGRYSSLTLDSGLPIRWASSASNWPAIAFAGVPAAARNAYKMVRRGGGMCEVGFFMDGGECSINPHYDLCNKEIMLVGSWVYTPQDYPTTFAFLKRAKGIGLPVEELVTHHFKLDDIDAAFKTNLAMTGIKVAVVCD